MTKRVNVLDYGYVRLVSHMQPSDEENKLDWTGDLEISRNARVSYDAPPRSEDKGLINYLMKNHHTSPFESMVFTFEVKAPIFVFRQWHRHRTWSYNEVSARYTTLPREFYVPSEEHITTQHTDNKQMRTDTINVHSSSIQDSLQILAEKAFEEYDAMLKLGCPRELARAVLPLSTYSYMFATVNLHNLFHFIRLRDHEHAQYEIRVYAQALLKLIEDICPDAVAAFKEHG